MPSLEQLRHEEFADAVERARHLPLVLRLFTSKQELLPVRILMRDRREFDFRLEEVDLDGLQLVGLDYQGAPMKIPLVAVDTVSQRQPRLRNTLRVWLIPTVAAALFGGADLGSMRGAFYGALLGALVGGLISWQLQDSPAMYRWRRLYG